MKRNALTPMWQSIAQSTFFLVLGWALGAPQWACLLLLGMIGLMLLVQLWAYLYCRKHHPERLLPEDELLRRRRKLLDERRKEGV